jgi:large subunit ribosomal protein L33
MAKSNEKRIDVTLECTECKRRNYITKKNKVNDRERIELRSTAGGTASTPCTRRPASRETRRPVRTGRRSSSGAGPRARHRRARRGAGCLNGTPGHEIVT